MFELIDNTTARVNDLTVYVAGRDERGNPVPEAVDASAIRSSGPRNLVQLRDLRGVTPSQFPEKFYFSIWNLAGAFRRLSGVKFERVGKRASIIYYFDLEHESWEHRFNLNEFVDLLCSELRLALPDLEDLERSSSDGVVYISLRCHMSLEDECPVRFGEVDRKVVEVYRLCMRKIDASRTTSSKEQKLEPEYKWWLRYVIVPLLCSGTVAGIAAWLWSTN